ncbi:DUF441 family protein [Limnochorda pilosa]|uniref:UPF0756 membrane protein LIP_3179 n=1 Tax=Limnochorda pilosa TaxID=1555112 RepID=A0A0K2SPS2_LIMPI|nr:DUF441 family protein [Limnochorda pilosa]BAS29002.1 membrane protein [Limnochorda pilosa]
MEGKLVLLVLMAAGVLGGNDLVATAAAALLIFSTLGPPAVLDFLEEYTLSLGVLLLLISLLLPFARGQIGLSQAGVRLASVPGIVALAVGAGSAWLAAQGINLLQDRPETMLGMVIGSVFGVLLLDGIPAGPLVASGLAAVLLRLLRQ